MTLSPGLLKASWAVCRRHLTIYVRYRSWFIALLFWPVLFPFGYVFTSKALAGPEGEALATFSALAGTTDYTAYITMGTVFWMWFNVMLWGFGGALRTEQMRGTMESNYMAPVPKVFLLLGSFGAEALMGLVMLAVSFTTISLVWGVGCAGSLWHLAVVALASIPSIYGVGMVFASVVLVAKETSALIFFVRGLMTVFCGVIYPIAVLPDWMRSVATRLPLTHSIQAVRHIIAGGHLSGLGSEIGFLLWSGAILLLAGYVIYLIVERRMLARGTVGEY